MSDIESEVDRMSGPKPPQIVLNQDQRLALEQIVRAHSSGQALVRRARVVLLAAMGYSNMDIAREVPMDEEAVGLWRRRWHAWRAVPLEDLTERGG
jgi:DNA-binding NarL/FixJ family response regulator